MIKKIVPLLLLSFLVFSSSLMASDIRMMGLANPFLLIPDPDTDWNYNPTYLNNAPEQVYTQYIFGYGDFTNNWNDQVAGGFSHTTTGKGIFRSNDGELGFIKNLNKGKLAFIAGNASSFDDLHGVVYSNDMLWSNNTHFPSDYNRDTNVTGAYVYPLSQELSLGISGSWDRVNNHQKIFNVYVGSEDTSVSVYNRWDCTLGLSWQLKPEMLLGLSAGAGQLPGDFYYEDNALFPITKINYRGNNGDYNGTQAHLLGNFIYKLNDRTDLSAIMRGRWQNAKFTSNLTDGVDPVGNNENRDRNWDALFGIGGVYTINKDSGFILGGGVYYSYNDWRHKYDQDAIDGLLFNSDREKSNTVQLRLGTEKKLIGKLTGRAGVYYSYSFIDKYESYNGTAVYELVGGGFMRTLGIGTGLSYNFNEKLRLDLGFDIPIITDRLTSVTGSADGDSMNSHRYSDQRDYRAGINLAYLF